MTDERISDVVAGYHFQTKKIITDEHAKLNMPYTLLSTTVRSSDDGVRLC